MIGLCAGLCASEGCETLAAAFTVPAPLQFTRGSCEWMAASVYATSVTTLSVVGSGWAWSLETWLLLHLRGGNRALLRRMHIFVACLWCTFVGEVVTKPSVSGGVSLLPPGEKARSGEVVFPTVFNLSLNLAIRSSWSEPQSAPGLVFSDCIELLHLWLQRI